MSNKRSTAARKRTLRDRRRDSVANARNNWSDAGFGIKIGTGRAGRMETRWAMDHDPYLALMGLARYRSYLEEFEVQLVARCRLDGGLSWDEIGWALEVSGEAVRKRLGARVQVVMDQPVE